MNKKTFQDRITFYVLTVVGTVCGVTVGRAQPITSNLSAMAWNQAVGLNLRYRISIGSLNICVIGSIGLMGPRKTCQDIKLTKYFEKKLNNTTLYYTNLINIQVLTKSISQQRKPIRRGKDKALRTVTAANFYLENYIFFLLNVSSFILVFVGFTLQFFNTEEC